MTSHDIIRLLRKYKMEARYVDLARSIWERRERLRPEQRDLMGLVSCRLSRDNFEAFPAVVRLTEVGPRGRLHCPKCGHRGEVSGRIQTVILVRGSDGQYCAVRAE